ncbi:MAG: DUF975 family protein [Clostridia bacterium]|nr:DUF975 family protein [Clostridia bacterium]
MFFSALWKMKARAALKGKWLTGLLIALIVNLPGLLVQGIGSFTGNSLSDRLADLLVRLQSTTDASVIRETLDTGVNEILGARGIWMMQGASVLVWALTPCLALGMIHWLQATLRKEPAGEVSAVFSRIGLFGKAIGLRLYVALRVFLWMLPGMGLMAASLLPLWLSDSSSRISVLSAANTAYGLQSVSMIVAIVLAVMAYLKYAMADQILADHPEKGPVQAAKESRTMMKGKRGALFSLYTGFLLWYFLETMAVNLVSALFGSVIGLMAGMLCSLALTVYLRASVSAFYLTCLPAETGGLGPMTLNPEDGGMEL